MCRYDGLQLNLVERNLMKIKALAELLSFYERENGGAISGQSLQEIGLLMEGFAKEAQNVFSDDDNESPAAAQGGE